MLHPSAFVSVVGARLCAAAGVMLASGLAAADVTAYAVSRAEYYTQTSDGPPAGPELWLFTALIVTDVNNEVLTSSVSFGPPPTEYNLVQGLPTLYQYYSSYYSSYPQFLSDYPATTYTLSADRGAGVETGDVFLPEDMYPTDIPMFTGDTHSRLQLMDPFAPFDGTINGFTPAPGTNISWTYVDVAQEGIPSTVWSTILAPGDTDFQIPADVLIPGVASSIGITYLNEVLTPGAGFGNAESGAEFYRATGAYFTTAQTCGYFTSTMVVGTTCPGPGQLCGEVVEVVADTCGLLKMEFTTSPFHCSDVGLNVFLDGSLVAVTPAAPPGTYSGIIDLTTTAGAHTLRLQAYGVEGGCNIGTLETWAGTLRLHRCGDPAAVADPQSTSACANGTAYFGVATAGTAPFTYEWQAQEAGGGWISLTDGDVAGVGTVSGSATDLLAISFPQTSGLEVRVIATNGCASSTSGSAVLTITEDCAPCPADFNQDGGIDGADVEAFFAVWELGDSAADVNYDGGVDGADVETFFAAWEAGGCN